MAWRVNARRYWLDQATLQSEGKERYDDNDLAQRFHETGKDKRQVIANHKNMKIPLL